jgi:hypothetical protein
MGERGMTIQFLTGEAMWPDRVNRRWPGAQFVARARIERNDVLLPAAFAILAAPAIWGVLIALPVGTPGDGSAVIATTDLGDVFGAWFESTELLEGDPESVVAAARYWELPWRYVGALRDALGAQGIEILDEEPRDDAVTTAGT